MRQIPLSDRQITLRDQLRRDVHHLADKIGPRSAGRTLQAVLASERWIIDRLSAEGIQARRDEVDLGGAKVANIEATFPGTRLPDEIVVIGGHYDTVANSPGADDNASGVALLLAVAGYLTENPPERTVPSRFSSSMKSRRSQAASKWAAGCTLSGARPAWTVSWP